MTKRNLEMVTIASEYSKFRDCPKISEQCTITLDPYVWIGQDEK